MELASLVEINQEQAFTLDAALSRHPTHQGPSMPHVDPGDITRLLVASHNGDQAALDQLFPLIYDELRLLARRHLAGERPGHTLDSVALVNEIYLKLIGKSAISSESRGQFFKLASEAMRLYLVDYARSRNRKKRGGGQRPVALDDKLPFLSDERADFLVALDEGLHLLAGINVEASKVVELRFFCGLTLKEIAEVMDLSFITVRRRWEFARAWLYQTLGEGLS